MTTDVRVLPRGAWAEGVARSCVDVLRGALDRQDRAVWVLTGGRSPLPVYRHLARAYREALDWSRVAVLLGDERWVPFDHPESNFGAAREAMLRVLPLAPEHVLPFPTDAPTPGDTAERFAETLHALYPDGEPAFDLVLLGIGDDGHIGSLFPGSEALNERTAWTAHTVAPAGMAVPERVTLTLPALDASRRVFFLAAGEEKAAIVARALEPGAADLPVHSLAPAGPVTWWLDAPAASRLPSAPPC